MKQLYTELQEAGWKEKEIKQIPNKLAWEMAGSKKIKEEILEIKAEEHRREEKAREEQ